MAAFVMAFCIAGEFRTQVL